MPGFFHDPMDRKTFLKSSAAIAAGLWTSPLVAGENDQPARVALLSDTHIPADPANGYRGFRPIENLETIVPQVLESGPQATIINGDAARLTGESADYVVLKSLLKPIAAQIPIHIGLGNHDHRDNFFAEFPIQGDSPVQDKHVSVFELAGTRFILLDSLLYVDKVAGLLGKAQREWLAQQVPTFSDKPTVFFVHHTLGDGDGDLLDFDRFFDIVKSQRHVKAIFYGHSHRYHIEQRDHIYLINQPATGYNFSDDQPIGWLEAKFSSSGVELKLHAIGGNVAEDGETTSVTWA